MILADTSIWVDHLREGTPRLVELLEVDLVLTHPFILGELALGNIGKRELILRSLESLPFAYTASDEEVMGLIERRRLFGRGIGHIDAHLLAAALVMPDARLWTFDKRLAACADELGVIYR